MTAEELIKSGYRKYPPNQAMGDAWTCAFQKAIWKDGKRAYFIDVHEAVRETYTSYEIFMCFNHGCKFFPSDAAMNILIFAGSYKWSVEEVEMACDEIAKRLKIKPYDE